MIQGRGFPSCEYDYTEECIRAVNMIPGKGVSEL